MARYVRGADGREYWHDSTSGRGVDPTVERAMTAKFAGTCRVCGGRFEVGCGIVWAKALGARHQGVCPTVEVAAKADRLAEAADALLADAADALLAERDAWLAEDAADALLNEYAAIQATALAARRAAGARALAGRKLVYRVSLTGEARRYGTDVVNVQVVPNAKFGNAKIGEFRGESVGLLRADGTIKYWPSVNSNDARVQAVVAGIDILLGAADPIEYAKAYATESRECMRCGDTLVDDHGNPYFPLLGPVCGKKYDREV